jgi:hypothetical protein
LRPGPVDDRELTVIAAALAHASRPAEDRQVNNGPRHERTVGAHTGIGRGGY